MDSLKILFIYMKEFKKSLSVAIVLLIVLSVLSIIPAILVKNIFDVGISNNNFNYVLIFSSLLGVIYLLKSILNYFSNLVFTKVSQNIIFNLRKNISSKLLRLPMEFFNFHPSGYLTSRLNEVNNISGLISSNTFKVLLSFFELLTTLIILININLRLTLILCLMMPVYYIVSNKYLSSIYKISTEAAEKSAILNDKIQQSVQGIEEVKNLSVEQKETDKINSATKDLVDASIKQSILYSVGLELIILIGSLSSVLLIVLGGRDVITANMTMGGYIVFMNYLPKLYSPVQSISTTALTIQPAIASLKRLHIFLDEVGENDESKEKINCVHSIEFKNVSFRYKEGQPYVLNDISFALNSNDKLLIKGENGTGKTTIFRIIMGLYNIKGGEGEVLINGVPITKLDKQSLRKNIGIVSQKIYLFNDTIENNIKYGTEYIDEVSYKNILNITGLDKIIASFPEGENKLVGENGSNLSGGQIQRIAIARALLKGAKILLFDEAVSNMDIVGRLNIKDLLESDLNNYICLVIDHGNDFDYVCNKKIVLQNKKDKIDKFVYNI
ncbi:ABC transporter ATP-binding protein/permease [Neobacillus sp. SM06]|uniref:ABC transporter ATP-binding protein/permease n=1 Tax=Neobacillus sp. SM06 TaxID=3422492 RepID=UPI003D2E9C44